MEPFIKYVKKALDELNALLTPIKGKPAMISSIVIAMTVASLDAPLYAGILLIPFIFIAHVCSRPLQWVIFISLFLGIISVNLFTKPELSTVPSPCHCGTVETVQERASGLVTIIKTDSYKVRLTEKRQLPVMPLPGDSICYEASWYPITPPTVPGAFDTRQWLASQGIVAYGKFRHWDIYGHHWIPERSFYNFRKWIGKRFSDFLDPAETGLLLGLLAGDKSGIPDALRSDFQRSGLVHVLAISGFHVVLLAGMLMIMLKATGLPHHLVRILAVLLLIVYIPITGGSPAVRRAVIMFAVPQIGIFFQKEPNAINSLGVALLFIILPDPHIIWNPGFQLSVAATAGIIISGPLNPLKRIQGHFQKNKVWSSFQNFILEPTYITLCATLSTAPFLVHHFKTLSPFAWLGNIIVVPAISMGMQAGLFALLSPLDFLREHFCYAARFFLRLATLLTKILSSSSQASTTVGPFGPALLLLFGVCILLLPAYRKNQIARFFALVGLIIFCGYFALENFSKANNPQWKLTSIDIGQGDSHLITTPSGRHFLVDAGDSEVLGGKGTKDSGKDIIVPYLHHIGVQSLDALIITHPDLDHYGGSLAIIKGFPVKEMWITDCARVEEKESWQQVIAEAYKRNIIIRDINRGTLWKENFFQIQILHPNTSRCTDVNTQSITFRAKGLGHSALLTGDLTVAGEKEILKTNVHLQSDILKLGHHGSKTSSSTPFLQEVQPKLALISSGRHNRFRHPSKQVILRLDSLDIPYLNTAENGSIDITFSAREMTVHKMIE